MSVAKKLSGDLLKAYETGQPIEPVRTIIKGVDEAYAVQRETVRVWLERGRTVAGLKIGLTAKAIQAQLGVDEPDFGTLFSDMILSDGAQVSRHQVMQPRIEAEIAFVMKSDLRGEHISPEQVLAATDYVVPSIEICGSRIARWDIRIEDTVADNASAALVVLGTTRQKPTLEGLAAVPMTLQHNDAVVAEGRGDACLGNPAIAVAWLAQTMTRYGHGLRAGDVVMSGALAKMIAAEPGSRFRADFGDLGSVSVSFAPT
jgi:2-keto-4-pentenoate hydratase